MNDRRNPLAGFIGMVVVAAIVLAACGSAVQPNTADVASAKPAPSSAGSAVSTADTDSKLPADFQIAAYQGQDVLGGQEVQFGSLLAQGKPVVLNLWAGLCPPCRLEMPDFEAANEVLGDQVLFFGLDVGPFTNLGTSDDGRALIQELGITYPIGTTADADVVRDYGLLGMPTTYFISPEGEIIEQWTGLLTEEKLTELVEDLLLASADS